MLAETVVIEYTAGSPVDGVSKNAAVLAVRRHAARTPRDEGPDAPSERVKLRSKSASEMASEG